MEDLHFLRLWDVYHGLLTKTQREITNLYFNCDLSLAEIAEEKGVRVRAFPTVLRSAVNSSKNTKRGSGLQSVRRALPKRSTGSKSGIPSTLRKYPVLRI